MARTVSVTTLVVKETTDYSALEKIMVNAIVESACAILAGVVLPVSALLDK